MYLHGEPRGSDSRGRARPPGWLLARAVDARGEIARCRPPSIPRATVTSTAAAHQSVHPLERVEGLGGGSREA